MSPTRTAGRPATLSTRGGGPLDRSIAVLGLGYVGLPTALAFAQAGRRVIGIDTDRRRLERIRTGEVDLAPDERRRLADVVEEGSLALVAGAAGLERADAVVICVPTPIDEHLVVCL